MNATMMANATPEVGYTIWQCPDCFGEVQHQRAERAETFVICHRLAQDWSRICGRRMTRTLVVGVVLDV